MIYYPMYKPFYQSKTIYKYVKEVFPLVEQELSGWRSIASDSPDSILSAQALASIQKKSFHAQGGSIYGLYRESMDASLVQFIVAIQTISDYLDNLCDRVGVEDQTSFLQLHQAITDALNPSESFADYYAYYPHREDGGYLHRLVQTCKEYIRSLPSYSLVQEPAIFLGKLYSEMQSYKHIALEKRDQAMHLWAQNYLHQYPELSTWEFSAAAGSTLGIFMLCALASDKDLTHEEVQRVMDAYFPWICGLHILLDYFIDQQEDLSTGDLNFVSYYKNKEEKQERLTLFLQRSFEQINQLSQPLFHHTVIEGLLAMYFSDPKTDHGEENLIHKKVLKTAPLSTSILYSICKCLRKQKRIRS